MVNKLQVTWPFQLRKGSTRLVLRVNNKRGECLTPYSPIIDDCAEVKWLPLCVTYRLASIFSHLTTKTIPDTRACVLVLVRSMFKFTTKSIALLCKEAWLLTLNITLGERVWETSNTELKLGGVSLRSFTASPCYPTFELSSFEGALFPVHTAQSLVQSSNILEDPSRCG